MFRHINFCGFRHFSLTTVCSYFSKLCYILLQKVFNYVLEFTLTQQIQATKQGFNLKAALNNYILTTDEMTVCTVKETTHSDEPRENYHSIVQLYEAF